MAKPNIQNITTTQTFQNWFDKTNEMVDLMRSSVITATALGDSTTGDASLAGDFTANNIFADTLLKSDTIESFSSNNRIDLNSPIKINGSSKQVAIFNFNTGAQTRYTDGTLSWDMGINNSSDGDFVIDTGSGDVKFKLSTAGTLDIINLNVSGSTNITGDIDLDGTFTGNVSANTISFVTATGGTFTGDHVGDIYASDGSTKVFENGNGTAAGVAQFTGNVQGTVSSLTNHYTDALAEKPANLGGPTNLWYTDTRARSSISAGTGMSYDSSTGEFSIGQTVATTSDVTFGGVSVDGSIVATGNITAYGTVSDITMKENITPIDNALEKVQQLGGYLFNYKGDDTQMSGVMAQEIKDVVPGIVYEIEDPNTKETVYAVRHGNLVGLLIEAIKELTEKVGK